MEKLGFEFIVKAVDDPKTNTICISSITTTNKESFTIPEQFQPARLHEAITRTQTYQKVKATLQKRHDRRHVCISLTQEISKTYIDEDGNMQFKGYLLEEIKPSTQQGAPTTAISEEALTRILENITEKKNDTSGYRNMRKLSENFVIEKFTRKTSNVSQWMNTFERECTRLGIKEDWEKIEVLRLFLEESCLDWYSSMLIKHTMDSSWSTWKDALCETYADKGWTPIRYAISFRYVFPPTKKYTLS